MTEAQALGVQCVMTRYDSKMGCSGVLERTDVIAISNYVGKGYALPGEDTLKAIRLCCTIREFLVSCAPNAHFLPLKTTVKHRFSTAIAVSTIDISNLWWSDPIVVM